MIVWVLWIVGFVLTLILELVYLKYSAEKSYRIKVDYGQAFKQWLWMLLLRFVTYVISIALGLVALIILGSL
ncbi:MAG: hypothetical protein ACTSW1_00695 [Candidatus Hodarchaeales archaeon]